MAFGGRFEGEREGLVPLYRVDNEQPREDRKQIGGSSELKGMFGRSNGMSVSSRESVFSPTIAFLHTIPQDTMQAAVKVINKEYALEFEQKGGLLCQNYPQYLHEAVPESIIGKRDMFPMWQEETGCQILFQATGLSFGIGDLIEPLFCSVSLVDIRHRVRASEEFLFDLNRDDLLTSQLSVARHSADQITLARASIFKVSDVREGLALVLRIYRVLQGDPSESDAPYLKEKQRNANDLKKLSDGCKEKINRLYQYRQLFAIAALPLFSETGDMLLSTNSVMDRLYLMSQQPDEKTYYDVLDGLVSGVNTNNLKQIFRGRFEFSCHILDDYERPPFVVDPTFIPLKQSERLIELDKTFKTNPSQTSETMAVKEIEEFPLSLPPHPFLNYVHNLYVYPIWTQQKNRNISVRVQLRTSDEVLNAEDNRCIKSLYGASSGPVFQSSLYTACSYHEYSSNFLDEIKILLPFAMSDDVHLFFTFYQIACQHKIGKGVQEVLGYSLIRLYPNSKMLSNGEFNLPVAAVMPERNYLMGFISSKGMEESKGSYQWLANGQPQFKIRIKVNSTLFNQDQHVNALFHSFPTDALLRTESKHVLEQVGRAVENLRYASPDSLIQFLTPILSFLVLTLGTGCSVAQIHAFYGLVYISESVASHLKESSNERLPILMTWVQNLFVNPPVDPDAPVVEENLNCLYVNILTNFYQVLQVMDVEKPTAFQLSVLKNSWLWLELAFKSCILDASVGGSNLEQLAVNQAAFLQILERLLELCVDLLSQHRKLPVLHLKRLNANLSVFLVDLFCVIKKRDLVPLVLLYSAGFDVQTSVALEMKAAFIQIFIDSDWFIEICEPHVIEVEDLQNSTVQESIQTIYPLVSIAIEFVVKHFNFITTVHRPRVIDLLRVHLIKFDYDSRFQEESLKSQIATMFFPFVPALAFRYRELQAITPELRKNLLACWLWILRYTPRPLIIKWFSLVESSHELFGITQLLEMSITLFEYKGRKLDDQEIDDALIASEALATLLADCGITGAGTVKRGAGVAELLSQLETMNTSPFAHATGIASATGVQEKVVTSQMSVASGTVRGTGKHNAVVATTGTIGAESGGGGTMRDMRKKMMANAAQMRTGTVQGGTVRGPSKPSNAQFGSKSDAIRKLVLLEAGLNQTVGRLLISLIGDLFVEKRATFFTQPDIAVFPLSKESSSNSKALLNFPAVSLSLITSFLKSNQTDETFLSFYPLINFILYQHSPAWFEFIQGQDDTPLTRISVGTSNSTWTKKDREKNQKLFSTPVSDQNLAFATLLVAKLELLCRELLIGASYNVMKMREYSISMLYCLIRSNFIACGGSLTFIQNIVSTALSNVINYYMLPLYQKQLEFFGKDFQNVLPASTFLLESLATIVDFADQDCKKTYKLSSMKDYVLNVKKLIDKMITILKQSLEIARQEHLGAAADPTQLEDLLFGIADVHNHLPEVRIAWLKRLAVHHQNVGTRSPNNSLHNHAEAAQCLIECAILMEMQATSATYTDKLMRPIDQSKGDDKSSAFVPRHVKTLLEACQELDKAQLYEQSYNSYQPCLEYFLKVKDYEQLSKCHLHIYQMMEKLINEDRAQQRLFGTYYRVGFYGTKFGELHGKEFVYKKQKICRLPEISSELKELYSKQLGVAVKVHPNSSPIDMSSLDLNECLLQITVLKPNFGANEIRTSYFDRNTNLSAFTFSTPFTLSGGAHGDFTCQLKRITTCYVETPFPFGKTRQLIHKREELVLEPAENVADDIQMRTIALEEQITSEKIELKNLQPTLHGALLAQVNGGIMPLCKAFLSKEYSVQNPTAVLQPLRTALKNFLAALERAVDLHRKLSQVEADQEMQHELEKSLEDTRDAVTPYLFESGRIRANTSSYGPATASKPVRKIVGFAAAATVVKVMAQMSKLEADGVNAGPPSIVANNSAETLRNENIAELSKNLMLPKLK